MILLSMICPRGAELLLFHTKFTNYLLKHREIYKHGQFQHWKLLRYLRVCRKLEIAHNAKSFLIEKVAWNTKSWQTTCRRWQGEDLSFCPCSITTNNYYFQVFSPHPTKPNELFVIDRFLFNYYNDYAKSTPCLFHLAVEGRKLDNSLG